MKSRPSRLPAAFAWLSVACAIAILCSPRPAGMSPEAFRLVAVVVAMAGLWVTQAISLAATSLLPLILFPFLGIQTAKQVSQTYVNDMVFLYLGGFIIALGIERWSLHRRIALHIVRLVGVSPKRLVLGFMLATAGLSIWISNTASALLMLPIAIALLKTLADQSPTSAATDSEPSPGGQPPTSDSSDDLSSRLAVPLLLGIAYSASLGGMTSIIGTPTNNQAVGIYHEQFPDQPELTVARWMMACVPIGFLYLTIAWAVLTFRLPGRSDSDDLRQKTLNSRLKALGKPTSAELRMLIVFCLTAFLWVFRKPLMFGSIRLLPGWSEMLPGWFAWLGQSTEPTEWSAFVNDSTISMAMAFVLFCLPSGNRDQNGKSVRLMNWKTASALPWDVVLLIGSGFALASGFGTTGLSEWTGEVLQQRLGDLPEWLIIASVCFLMTFLTEFTSNVATVSTLMPTLASLCVALSMDPRMLMVPAALATSCAFMLPIATPPNAIVFGSGRISVRQMASFGIALNLLGVPILTAAAYLVIKPILGIP